MCTNEILTLQFGHYSNFIGTHWWNIQELGFQYDPEHSSEINHDVLFREGQNLKGEVTFTPRLLLVDLKGSLKTLPEENELYSLPQESLDSNNYEVQQEKPPEKNSFLKDLQESGNNQTKKIYNLDNDVKVWSDFLYARFHPRTVNIIREYQHSDDNTPFNIFPLGTNLWKKEQFSEDFVDKIRNYLEECNNFQGFQLLTDSSDAFSGLASSCLEHLRDEYDSKTILGLPVSTESPNKNPLNLLTHALCIEALSEHCALFVPLGHTNETYDHISPKPDLPYHTSALIASTLDTLSLNYRLKNSPHTLADLCSDFSSNGRKGAAASLRLPFPLKKNEDFIDCLDNWEGSLTQSVTPNCQIASDFSLQLVVLRGVLENRLKRPPHVQTKQRDMPAYRCDSLKEMLDYYLVCTSCGSKSEVIVSREKMAVKTPFPAFFNRMVGRTGDVVLEEGNDGGVECVSVMAGLHSGKFVGNVLDVLSKNLEKIKFKKFHQFAAEGVESDQIRECFDKILDLRDCYEDNYLI